MKDKYNREISYLRLSVTDRCNFSCQYCMPENSSHICQLLTFDEMYNICKCAVGFGINKIRITGGEPLIREGVIDFCRNIKKITGLEELSITTNGSLLQNYAYDLAESGINRVNVSLDTLDNDKFYQLTKTNKLDTVLNGIKTALDAGLSVKINVVLIGGFNIDEIKKFVELTKENNYQIRFIELMPIGACSSWSSDSFVSTDTVLKLFPNLRRISLDGVAEVYKIDGYIGTVGLIRPISNMFCDFCNRIRITADGKLKTCLHSSDEYDLRNLSGDELTEKFKEAVFNKPLSHTLNKGCFSHSSRFMNEIGG